MPVKIFCLSPFSEHPSEDDTVGNTSIEDFLGQHLADIATKCPAHHHNTLTDEVGAEELKRVCPGTTGDIQQATQGYISHHTGHLGQSSQQADVLHRPGPKACLALS